MYRFKQSPELTEAESALLSLYREIRRHEEHKRLHKEIINLFMLSRETAKESGAAARARGEAIEEKKKALEAEQLAFIRREYGARIDAAQAAIKAAGGDPGTMILR